MEEKRPRGRPRKLDAKKIKQVLDVLRIGGSRADAAKLVAVTVSTIANEARRNPDFFDDLETAEAACKIHHIKKVREAKDWRSSAHMLKVKYPEEYGEKAITQDATIPSIEFVESDKTMTDMQRQLQAAIQENEELKKALNDDN